MLILELFCKNLKNIRLNSFQLNILEMSCFEYEMFKQTLIMFYLISMCILNQGIFIAFSRINEHKIVGINWFVRRFLSLLPLLCSSLFPLFYDAFRFTYLNGRPQYVLTAIPEKEENAEQIPMKTQPIIMRMYQEGSNCEMRC